MDYEQVTGISYEDFRQMAETKKVIIFHPATPHRTLYMAYLYRYAAANLVYYCSDVTDTTFVDWLHNLNVTLDLNVTVQQKLAMEDIPVLSISVAQALTQRYSEQCILLLDDVDSITILPEFRRFIREFIAALPDTIQIVISARSLTHEPFATLCRDGIAGVLGTAFRQNDLMYTVEPRSRPQLEVYAFGQGHGYMNGQEITQWDGALPRNLFFFFMDQERVNREDIFHVFWSNLSARDATNVFHVTKRKITERMSELVPDAQSYEMTQYTGGYYAASDKVARHYDVADFEATIQQAQRSNNDDEREHCYRKALAIYTAPYLETLDMVWVEDRRKKLARLHIDALADMGHLQQRKKNYAAALGFFMRTLREAPHREDIHRDIMTTYAQLGRKDDALKQYRVLEAYLDESIGLPPDRKTRDLYEQIKNQ